MFGRKAREIERLRNVLENDTEAVHVFTETIASLRIEKDNLEEDLKKVQTENDELIVRLRAIEAKSKKKAKKPAKKR